ncbi:MAG TPA: oligosaccharide flippase family protein [Candidatus Coprenecus stercoravium]|uniref:Oligosaccharide flippase family protein n=1 Tax=Candidatus Coprenecus stercoravium TaxID=2840735 RepID=A0A9D2GQV4_9BACT|nr:oligosaccharide flippase family protein [Candidatus Coprenecus stercoravium]
MRQILGKLAGQTVIYGTSTIVARFLNYMLLPLYTYTLTASDYGVLTEFMSYIAVLQVLLTMGLETGCFRFANKDGYEPRKVFSGALLAVSAVSAVFLLLMVIFGKKLSVLMGYGGYWNVYVYVGVILLTDSFTSVLFAKLRCESRAWRFAAFKTIKILTEAGCNLLLFLWYPAFAVSHPDNLLSGFIPAVPDFSYPIFSIVVSCVVCVLLFIPDLLRLRVSIDGRTVRDMLGYSLPLMVAGLPGVANDFLDRILFRFFNVDDTLWRADLGVYQAAVKVAVIMSLFVQMFRFAAEPFFFSNTRQKDFRRIYASVMEYFVMFCMLIFLGVTFYLDIIQMIVGRDFRAGMDIVPVMLLAYMMMGMLFNVSMWYKLSDRSSFAIYITLTGLAVTAVINICFLPVYSYHAAAWGHFASYLVMLVLCVLLGRKYYPIPYRWNRILAVVAFGLLLYAAAMAVPDTVPYGWVLALRTFLIAVYLGVLYLSEKYFKRHKGYESKNS